MNQPRRRTVTVGEGGVIHIVAPELAAGLQVQVEVQIENGTVDDTKGLPSLSSMIGAGKGCYTTAEDPIVTKRALRDECND